MGHRDHLHCVITLHFGHFLGMFHHPDVDWTWTGQNLKSTFRDTYSYLKLNLNLIANLHTSIHWNLNIYCQPLTRYAMKTATTIITTFDMFQKCRIDRQSDLKAKLSQYFHIKS